MKKILVVLSVIALNTVASENSIIEIYAMYAIGRDGYKKNLPHSWISHGNSAVAENKYPGSSEYNASSVAAKKHQNSKRVSFAQDKPE